MSQHSLHPRARREPILALTLAAILGLAGTGVGAAALITQHDSLSHLHATINSDLRQVQQSLTALEESLTSLSEVVLQNRRGLDLLFLKEGGLCVALKEECCFYTDHTGVARESVEILRKSLDAQEKTIRTHGSWYQQVFQASPWLTTLLSSLLGPLVIIILLLTFGPWIFRILTNFVKRSIQSAFAQNHPLVQYHRLANAEIGTQTINKDYDPLHFITGR